MKIFDKCYRSIDDLPVYNWFKVNTTHDFRYLLLPEVRLKLSIDHKIVLLKRWEKIWNQYIKVFGFGEQFLRVLEKKREIALLRIEKAETGDGTIETLIDIAEIELQRIESVKQQQKDFYEIKALLDRSLGFSVDIKKVSVMEFYSYFKNE